MRPVVAVNPLSFPKAKPLVELHRGFVFRIDCQQHRHASPLQGLLHQRFADPLPAADRVYHDLVQNLLVLFRGKHDKCSRNQV